MEVPQAVFQSVDTLVRPVVAVDFGIGPAELVVALLAAVGLVVEGHASDEDSRPLARETVLERVQAGLLVLDDDGTVLDANTHAATLLGVDRQTLLGTGIERLDPELAAAIDRDPDAHEQSTAGGVDSSLAPVEDDTDTAWVVTLQASEESPQQPVSSIVEAIDEPLFAVDDAGHFRFANAAFTDIFGGDPETIVGMHLSVVIDEAVAEQLVSRTLEVSPEALPETITFEVTTIDGDDQVLEARLTAFDDGVLCQISDVTDRERRRRALGRYRTIVDAMTDPAATVDETGQLTAANERLAQTSGYPRSMLVDQRLSTLIGASDVRRVESLLADCHDASEESVTIDTTLLTRNGEQLPVELESFPFEHPTAGDGFACIFRDTSTERQRQSDLQQYETIVEGLADPVWTISSDGTVTFLNRAFESKTGHSREAFVTTGRDLVDLVGSEDVDRLRTIVGQLVHGDREDPATIELELLTSDGLEIPVEMNLTALPDRDDAGAAAHGVAGVARDITDRRRRQEVLTVTNRVLRHNLRTHANMISGYADMLGTIADDPDAEEHIARIQASTDWLSKLGETLRDLQRAVEQNRTPSEPLSVESIASLAESYDSQHPDTAIQTTIDVQESIDAGSAFSRAVEHVLENAIVHNDADEPTVSITIRGDETDEEDWVLVEIADNGPGIPETERAVVLGETEVTQLEHGSGIGLWATRWLVQTIGGDIEITDNEPRGTVVTLRLPTMGQPADEDDED